MDPEHQNCISTVLMMLYFVIRVIRSNRSKSEENHGWDEEKVRKGKY